MMTDHGPGTWLLELAAALGFLALTGGLGRKLRISTVPGYLLGGVALGAIVDPPAATLQALTTLGAMLILFFVGLEFSPRELGGRMKMLIRPACQDACVNMGMALLAALVAGMSLPAALCFALAAYASSSAIIAKGLMDYRLVVLPEAEWCLGLLVVEDLVMAVLLPLTVVLLGASEGAGMRQVMLSLVAGLLMMGAVMLLARAGWVARWLNRPEKDLTLLASLSLVCLVAGIGEFSGISAAVGALLAGMMVAESDGRERIEALLSPHRELLAVGFFAAIGAASDWRMLLAGLPLALPLAGVTILAKLMGGWLAGRGRLSREQAIRLGLMLAPRGEFALVVAALALGQPWGEAFYNTVIAYVFITALVGALLMRYQGAITPWLAAWLPKA